MIFFLFYSDEYRTELEPNPTTQKKNTEKRRVGEKYPKMWFHLYFNRKNNFNCFGRPFLFVFFFPSKNSCEMLQTSEGTDKRRTQLGKMIISARKVTPHVQWHGSRPPTPLLSAPAAPDRGGRSRSLTLYFSLADAGCYHLFG